jgi:putative endonuclease
MPLYWYFYLVRCRDGSLYAGVTTDLWRRIGELNAGRETKVRRPVMLVYAERYALKRSALRRKREIRALQQAGEAPNASVPQFAPPDAEGVWRRKGVPQAAHIAWKKPGRASRGRRAGR